MIWRTGRTSAEGRSCASLTNEVLNFRAVSVDSDFDGGGRDAGPVLKFRFIEIDAAVFAGSGLEHAGGSKFNRFALESEFEGLAIGADCIRGAHADEGVI